MRNLAAYSICKEPTRCEEFLDIINTNNKIYAFKEGRIWYSDKLTGESGFYGNITYSNIISSFQYLPIDEAIYFSTSEAVVFITNDTDTVLFNFHSKIECTSWNPSQDILAIVFDEGEIGLFTFDLKGKTFDCKVSSHFDFDCPESITVGWGSSKTQFRGPLKKKTEDVLTIISNVLINSENELEPPSESDNKRPVITWRSNGEMFSVNFWKGDRRIIKLFDSECQPLFENSGLNGLQPILAWRPYGAGIASIATVKNKSYLILFEKNATLRHEFLLEHHFTVEDLKWDQSGNLLSTYLKIPEESSSQIRIYVIRNNYLYLKQTLHFSITDDIKNFKWLEGTSSSSNLTVTTSKFFITYRFKLLVNKMYVLNDFDCTIVAVIDGHTLHLCRHTQSDCSSHKEIVISEPINGVTLNQTERKLVIFGVRNLYIYLYQNIDESPHFLSTICLNNTQHFYNFHVNDDGRVRFIGYDIETYDKDVSIFELNHRAVNTNETSDNKYTIEEIQNNIVHISEFEHEIVRMDLEDTFRLSMDEHRNVYVNGKLIWNNITSFTIHNKCLFLTTKDSLIGIRLNLLQDVYEGKTITSYIRTIELGCVLICGMGSTSNLILQAPRGNIEIISCLLLNIDRIHQLLQEDNWKEAWDHIRILKLNSNLLFDLDPERFLNNISKFVESSVLSVFLSELEEDNILSKVYSKSGFKTINYENKLTTVCSKLIDFLTRTNYIESLSNIVHACLVMHPSTVAVKKALKHIQILFRYNFQHKNIQKSVEDAVKFMLKYVHVKDAYQAALSLHDLELAICIARNSEMDPKEYIDFITKLKSMSEIERNFTINDCLGNYSVAIFYLYELLQNNGYKKLIQYMERHDLQKALYDNISENSPIYSDVVKSYAEKLACQKFHNEAGLIFEKGHFYNSALDMYMESNNWKKVIEMMKNLNTDKITFKRKIREMAENLVPIGKEVDASYLYEIHLEDFETAIKVLSDKHHFKLAYELAKKYTRLDIVETNIKPSVEDFGIYLYKELEKLLLEYTKYKERLFVVRKEKARRFKFENENVDSTFQEYSATRGIDDDIYSLAGSVISTKHSSLTSSYSRNSIASSRSRRKEQRKKEDLREGGQYEDIALMKVLHEKVSAAVNYGGIVRELCFVMLELNFETDAKTLHSFLFNTQTRIKNEVKEIWPDTLLKQDEPQNYEIRALQDNLFSLDTVYWKPPVIKFDWVIHILS